MKALELCNKALRLLRQDEGDEYRYNVAIAVKEAIEELEQYIKENGELLGLQQQKIIELQNRSCNACKYCPEILVKGSSPFCHIHNFWLTEESAKILSCDKYRAKDKE